MKNYDVGTSIINNRRKRNIHSSKTRRNFLETVGEKDSSHYKYLQNVFDPKTSSSLSRNNIALKNLASYNLDS